MSSRTIILGGINMIRFKELKASNRLSTDFVNIKFSIEDTVEDLTNYRFDLLRGHAESDTFKTIMTGIQGFECNDYSVNLLNTEIRNLYKIRAFDFKNDEELISDIIEAPPYEEDNYSFFFDNLYSQYLDVIGNCELYLLKRMRTGELCECHDEIRGSRNPDKCKICFGTGYRGGFYPPMKIKVVYLNAPSKMEEMSLHGSFEGDSTLQFWTVNYPVIQENDIVLNSVSGDRFTVTNWQPSYKNGFLIRQTVQVDKLPETSIFYKIPV